MGMFNIFRTQRPQQFRYIPRHYDPEKEDLRQRLQQLNPEEADNSPEAMKHRISAGLRRRSYPDPSFRRRQVRKSNRRVIMILGALIMMAAYLIYKKLPAMMSALN
ncbi:MAG: hypothetical protein R3301_08995 [Saprospiraceae bacterium]|nr:hypothetical protein [Saprospiraceae bacterium]